MPEQTPAAPAATATTAPAATPAPGEEYKGMSPEAFKARLEAERTAGVKAALKELGFDKLDDAKARVAAAKSLEDAQKSELQRATERAAQLEARAKAADSYEATIKRYADQELGGLSPEAKRLVELQAGEDPHARLQAIANLRESGMLAKLGGPTSAPKGATTGATPGPAALQGQSPGNAYQQWEAMRAKDPTAAAHLYSRNRAAIEAARPKSE